MDDKYLGKYRIPSARAQWWDYSDSGDYFITICTKNREHFLGEISRNKMTLSQIGGIATSCWHEIPTHFNNVELDTFVIMPNHIHGIIKIRKPANDIDSLDERIILPQIESARTNSNIHKIGLLGIIIRSFKSAVTKNAKLINKDFAWQTRFYDHIIRDEKSLLSIRDYIVGNPDNWGNDKLNNKKI